MKDHPEKPYRRSIRLRSYDYSHTGAYFVTICTDERRCLFGEIINGEMHLNDIGLAVEWIWNAIPERFSDVKLDQYVIMPNHLHGIINLVRTDYFAHSDAYVSKIPERFNKSMHRNAGALKLAPTLGEIVRTFKALVTRYVRAAGVEDFGWQIKFYEHVIQSEKALNLIRQYIIDNPARWVEDELYA